MKTLLRYTLTKQRLDGDTWIAAITIMEQAKRCSGSEDSYEFTSSDGFRICSDYDADFYHSSAYLLGSNSPDMQSATLRFRSQSACDTYVSRFQQALAEWAEWGGFTERVMGKYNTVIQSRPAKYGGFTITYTETASDLEYQLATF